MAYTPSQHPPLPDGPCPAHSRPRVRRKSVACPARPPVPWSVPRFPRARLLAFIRLPRALGTTVICQYRLVGWTHQTSHRFIIIAVHFSYIITFVSSILFNILSEYLSLLFVN